MTPLAALLQTADVKGNPVKTGGRVKDVHAAYSIYRAMWLGDQPTALNRARMQLSMDGFPPFDPEMLAATGQSGIANINPGLLKTLHTEACLPILDQINTVEKYINVQCKKVKGDESDYSDQIAIVENEHYNMLKHDPNFNYRKIELVRQMVMYGITVPYFPDAFDWRWKSEPIGEFLIPHMTPANEESIEVAAMVRSRPPHEIACFLDDPNPDWNQKEIKRSLANAKPRNLKQGDWERFQAMWKGNDLYMTSQADEVTTVDLLVKELDGKVSHYIFTEDGQAEDYLYKNVGKFDSQAQAFILFTFDIATNGYYHSIRGLGSEALPITQEINRILSGFMDAVRIQSKLTIQARTEDSAQNLNFIEHSGYLLLPPGVDVVDRQHPNFSTTTLPALDYLSGFMNRKMSHYNTDTTFTDRKRRTKAEVMEKMQQLASLSEANIELFFQSWDRLIREQFRRIVRHTYTDSEPGGKEVNKFRKRCEERGVEDDFWDMIDLDRCAAERAVGAGSAAQQSVVMEKMMEFFEAGFFDSEGEYNFKKDAVRLYSGPENSVRYVGPKDTSRPMQDEKNANFENEIMGSGKELPVYDNDNHTVHAKVHIGASDEKVPTGSLSDDINTLQQALQSGDDGTILQIVPALTVKHAHCAEHIERMRNAPSAKMFKQKLQQIGGIIENAQKKMIHIQEEQSKQAQAAAGQQGQGGQNPAAESDFNLEREIVSAQVKLSQNQEVHQQKMEQKQEAADQDLHNKQRSVAQKLALDHAQAVAARADQEP